MINTKITSKSLSWIPGLIVICVCSFALTAIAAWLMANEKLPINSANATIAIIQCASVFLGAVSSRGHTLNRHIPVSLIVVLCYYFLLASGTILLYEGQFKDVGSNLIGGSIGFGLYLLICIRGKKRNYRYDSKRRNVKMNKILRKTSMKS